MLAGGIVAFPSALSSTSTAANSHVLTLDLLLTWAAAWIVAALFLLTSRNQRTPTWARVLTALSLAAWLPIAAESKLHPQEANIALVLTASAITVFRLRRGTIRWTAGLLMIAGACAFDATAMLWPIGCFWGSQSNRQRRFPAYALIAAGAIAIALAKMASFPVWTTCPLPEFLPAVHRDFALLAPVIILGLSGLLAARGSITTQANGTPPNPWFRGWAVAGTLGLMTALFGLPIDLRLCTLPLFWYMPGGLDLLRGISKKDLAHPAVLRYVGLVSCAIVIVLAWPGILRWLNGLLLMLLHLNP